MSPGLQGTLLRAREYAASQSEAQVLLEHLLLALTEDGDAAHVLDSCQVDMNRLRNDVAGYVGTLNDRVPPGTPGAPAISPQLTQVLKYATLAAQQGKRSSIDGAIVLAALVGDGRSMAASFLKAQGLTFEAAIQALRDAATRAAQPEAPRSGAPPAPVAQQHPAGQPAYQPPYQAPTTPLRADDILARARERVESRAQRTEPQPPRSAPRNEAPTPVPPPFEPMHEAPQHAAGPYTNGADPQAFAQAPEATQPPAAPPAPEAPGATDSRMPPFEIPGPAFDAAAFDQTESVPAPPDQRESVPEAPPEQPPFTYPPARIPDAEAFPVEPARPQSRPGAPERPVPRAAEAHWQPDPAQGAPPPQVPQGWAPPPTRGPPAQPGQGRPHLPPPPPSHGWTGPPQPPQGGWPSQPDGEARQGAAWPRADPAHAPRQHGGAPPGYATPPALLPPRGGALEPIDGTRRPAVDAGQISHSMPRSMKQGRPQVIEVRIERPSLAGAGGTSRSYALRPETVVARAIAVRLRPLQGRLIVDAASPETQWDQSGAAGAGRLASEAAVWRFTVTPLSSGRAVLQLGVSARTLGADGVLAETQLPDQSHEVRVAASYGRLGSRIGIGALIGIGSIVLLKLIESLLGVELFYFFKQLLRF